MENQTAEGNSGQGGIITARGTGAGLVIRLDGRADQESLRSALWEFVLSRKGFLQGNEVALEWVGTQPEESVVEEFKKGLLDEFNIKVNMNAVTEGTGIQEKGPSLFDGIEGLEPERVSPRTNDSLAQEICIASVGGEGPIIDSAVWDDPDARVLYQTLRSGQKVETEHALIIVGDVNSGAEIVAGGDIMILGALRGVAHAGAYDETGGGRFIFALKLQPTQLRIGAIISRGASDRCKLPEIAQVDGDMIVVEPYQSRNVLERLRIA